MNQDQFLSGIRTLLKIIGTALATHGAVKAAGIINGEDVTGLVLAIAGAVWSWKFHSDSTPASNSTNPTKTSLYVFLVATLAFSGLVAVTGCKTTPQQASYQAAGSASVTVEAALQAYNVFVTGKTDAATIKQNAAVKAAYLKYQAAMAVVCDAGAIYAASSGTNAPAASLLMQQAVSNANASIADLVALVQSFGVKL
jgi:hypothetical protein